MDEIFIYPPNDYRSFLEHHGIPGQKWGVRKAAWYPIAAFQKASNKIGTKVHEFREKRAAARKKKQQAKNLEKARETRAKKAQEEKDFEAEKKRILTSGTPGEVIKISDKLTNQEIQDALNRNRNLEQLRAAERTRIKDIKDAEFNAKYEKLDKIARTVGKVTEYANTAKGALDAYKGIKKLLEDDGPKITNIAEILKHPERHTDEEIKNASIRKKYEESLGIGKKEPEKPTPKKSPSADDVLKNPDKYSDDDVRDAWQRQQNINNMAKDRAERNKASSSNDGDSSSTSKPKSESKPKEETYKQTIEPKPKAEKVDNDQRGEFKSKVVDGEWSEIVTPKNVSTALTVASRAMNYYDSDDGKRAVRSFTNLLSGSTQKQLPDNRRNDRGQFLLEDNNKKR